MTDNLDDERFVAGLVVPIPTLPFAVIRIFSANTPNPPVPSVLGSKQV